MATRKTKPKRKVRSARAKSQAAKRGWITRRRNDNPLRHLLFTKADHHLSPAEVSERFDTAIKEALERGITNLKQARFVALGEGAVSHGANPDSHHTLQALLDNKDERYLYYLDLCELMDIDVSDANDFWFSPEI